MVGTDTEGKLQSSQTYLSSFKGQESLHHGYRIGIGLKAHNVIYNPANFQNAKPNNFGDNNPFV